MLNLIQMFESFTNGYRIGIIDIISLASILLTVLVIISKNPIVSVLFLIGVFFTIACYLILLGITFVGLSYLLVYVGAVTILFLFILMLINVRVSELATDTTNSVPLVFIIAILFNYPIQQILPLNALTIYSNGLVNKTWIFENENGNENSFFRNLNNYIHNNFFSYVNKNSLVTSLSWDGNLAETTHITSIGNIMYSSYSIWLIITSIILLLAMVGTIVITIKENANRLVKNDSGSSYLANK